jgi:small subunit ribosomal protein S20
MANIHSQEKRILRAERERFENRRYTSAIRTYFRRLQTAVGEGDDDAANAEHRQLTALIDKAVKRGALHRNTGARKKSRAARLRTAGADEAAPAKAAPIKAKAKASSAKTSGAKSGTAKSGAAKASSGRAKASSKAEKADTGDKPDTADTAAE